MKHSSHLFSLVVLMCWRIENAMKIYAEELRIIMDAIMKIIFDDGEDTQRDMTFRTLLQEMETREYPESVRTLCQQAAYTWSLANDMTEATDKKTLQQSAIANLLAAFGRINGLVATEAYILQRNKEQLGLR